MTLKSDAKFKEKLTLGSKNDTRNLVNFDASSGKTENLHLDAMLLLSIVYNVSAKEVLKNYLSWHWKRPFEGKLTFCLRYDMRNFMTFNSSSGKFENMNFDTFVSKPKKNRGGVSWKMNYGFKNDISILVNFHTSSWE